MGRQVDVVQKFIRVQSFGHNWRWGNGIRVEHLPRIHHIAALPQSPRVLVKNQHRARRFQRTDHLHVDVERQFMAVWKTMNGNANQALSSFLCVQKDFHQENGYSSDLYQKRSGFSIHEYKPQGEWDRVAELMMIKFGQSGHPVFRATSPLSSRNASKAKEVDNYQYTWTLTRERLKLFFAQLFLLISPVFTEQSQICVKNAKSAMLQQTELLWQDNLTSCLCQVWWRHMHFWMMILRKKKIYCKGTMNELKGYHDEIAWLNYVLMQDSWQQLKSDSISWRKTLHNSHTSQMQRLVVSTLPRDDRNIWPERLGSREHLDWARVGSHNQLLPR